MVHYYGKRNSVQHISRITVALYRTFGEIRILYRTLNTVLLLLIITVESQLYSKVRVLLQVLLIPAIDTLELYAEKNMRLKDTPCY